MKRGRPVSAKTRIVRREEHRLAHTEFVDGCRRCIARETALSMDYSKRRRPEMWRPDQWDSSEDARLVELLGRFTPVEIAAKLNAEFHRVDQIVRTEGSITNRVKRKGLSRWMLGYRLREVEMIFHFDHRGIHQHWLNSGLLVPTRTFKGRGNAGRNYVFSDQDLEHFVRSYPWAYDYRRMESDLGRLPAHMRPIAQRLRQLAEQAWLSDPYLTRDEFLPLMGWKSAMPWKLWALERQAIPFKRRRHSVRRGVPGDGEILVRAADVPSIQEAIAGARQANWAAGARGRRGKPAQNRGKRNPPLQILALRCFVCHSRIVRKFVLPLHCPDCHEVAWNPKDVPTLDLYEDARGGIHVRNWIGKRAA